MSALKKTIPESYVTEYAAGTISPIKHLMLACQRDLSDTAKYAIQSEEKLGADFMMTGEDKPLSDDFMRRALSALPDQQDSTDDINPAANDLLPAALNSFMKGEPITWSFFAPGMHSMSLWQGESGQQLWLLKVKGGKSMPEHTHVGEEWSLILQGSYHVNTNQYVRGDLHVEDENCTHIPRIDPGVDCICLVLTEGPLQPTSLIPKLLMPFARI